jgi:hypothetical protein
VAGKDGPRHFALQATSTVQAVAHKDIQWLLNRAESEV